ncbi:hypothetical protein R84B8_02807 [Treponema sp. R8-4-B8]
MPQIRKGGKYVFGWSVIRNDFSIQFPIEAINEYNICSEGRVFLITGSKTTGGFTVSKNILNNLSLKIGDKLLSIRSSDIAFMMGVKGPLINAANNYKGKLNMY